MGFRNVPIAQISFALPLVASCPGSGAFGGGWGSAEGCDSAAIASVFETCSRAVASQQQATSRCGDVNISLARLRVGLACGRDYIRCSATLEG